MEIFKAQKNLFGGVMVEAADLPINPGEFETRLDSSIDTWKAEGIKLVWLSVTALQSTLIPLCTERGFTFHHTDGDKLQMVLTLIPGSNIPPYASHYVGAGGVVIDADNRLLVVSERYKLLPGRRLKLPGGALLAGEHISTAVVREVKEETGIDAKFNYLVCLRHWHNYRHGKSDIYFVCRLSPLSTEIVMDTRELVECLWLPVEEYLADPDVHNFNKLVVRAASSSKAGLSDKFIPDYKPEIYELLVP